MTTDLSNMSIKGLDWGSESESDYDYQLPVFEELIPLETKMPSPGSVTIDDKAVPLIRRVEVKEQFVDEVEPAVERKIDDEPLPLILDVEAGEKNRLCSNFRNDGDCCFGDNCRYAHGLSDQNCFHWMKGNCRAGKSCMRAHRPEFKSCKTTSNRERTSQPIDKPENKRYKTVICKTYQRGDRCRYGMKCQFAHGENELRSL